MNITLKHLIEFLESQDPNKIISHGFSTPDSYRGNYFDLAFMPEENVSIQSMLDNAKSALNKTFEGYKGGEYKMDEDTGVYIATYGCLGEQIGLTLMKYWSDE